VRGRARRRQGHQETEDTQGNLYFLNHGDGEIHLLPEPEAAVLHGVVLAGMFGLARLRRARHGA
jgi:hypothetical protein